MLSRLLNLVLFGIVAVLFQQYRNINEQLVSLQKSFDAYRVNAGKIPLHNSIYNVGTSVWCKGEDYFHRVCRFKNLCYSGKTEDFVFLHSKQRIMVGVAESRFSPALLDLSAVYDHNIYHFNYVDLPLAALHTFVNVQFIGGTSLIFARYMPQNLMHAFHDDLLPLFLTLRDYILPSDIYNPDLHLVLMDDAGMGDDYNVYLYDMFSPKKLIHKSDFPSDSLVCFENVVAGLSTSSLWYQYGFKKPQGPLPNVTVSARDIYQFTSYLRVKLNISTAMRHSVDKRYAVLIIRKANRVILNVNEVISSISARLGIDVVTVSEDQDLYHIIPVVSHATLLIGMHGSLMIISMFLPHNAIVIELYPYAIPPENYTPYASLCKLPGMKLIYRSWSNTREGNTVTHPDRSWMLGGINHLGLEEQNKIKSSSVVPEHLCCDDPQWLFRIYQDTVVDVASLMVVIIDALSEWQVKFGGTNGSNPPADSTPTLHPATVSGITCLSTSRKTDSPPNLKLTWKPPWNLRFLNAASVKYEVWLQRVSSDEYSTYLLATTHFIIKDGLNRGASYKVWIRNVVNETVYGPFNTANIQCDT